MYYDALLLLILGWSTWRGSTRGVTWQLASIASLLLCFAFAAPASLVVAPLIKLDPPLNRWLAMLAVYILFSFGAFAAARVVRSLLAAFKFQEFDHHLGGLFGLLKGALACLILTFFVVTLSASAREQVLRTHSGRVTGYLLYRARGVLPQELAPTLAPHFDVIRNELIEIATEQEQAPGPRPPTILPFDLNPAADEARGDRIPAPPRPANPRDRKPPLIIAADPAPRDTPDADHDAPWDSLANSLADRLKSQIGELLNPTPAGSEEEGTTTEAGRAPQPGSRRSPSPGALAGGPASNTSRVTPTGGTAARPGGPARQTGPVPGPANPPQRVAPANPPDPDLARLTADIVQAFASSSADRSEMSAGIAEHLRGLPPSLVRLVLQDWKADIYGNVADPDPGTSFETPIERRIVRQLNKAGIPLSQLPAEVQQRLPAR